MNILLTGGAGFVGINLARSLAGHDGVRVIAADVRTWSGAGARFLAPVQTRLSFAPLDVRDGDALIDLVQSEQITHIVHAAAITASEEQEYGRATEVVGVNLGGAINALNAALACDHVERVLLISSSGVYGAPKRPTNRPQRESGPLDLSNLYAITKHSAELLAARYAHLAGKPTSSLRLSAVYGPLEQPSASRPNTSAMQRLQAALRDLRPVRVAGPAVRRDWTSAADIGLAVFALLDAPVWRHHVYNVSCGVAVRFDDVVAAFVEHGLAASWIDDPGQADIAMRPHQERAALDITRLCRDTTYRPNRDLRASLATWLADEAAIE